MFIEAHDTTDIRWFAPVLPDRKMPTSGPDSPIARRVLQHLELRSGERVLLIGGRDPQLVQSAAGLVGPSGRVRCVEASRPTLRRLGRHLACRPHVELVFGGVRRDEREGPSVEWDAIGFVHRNGVVPDPTDVARLLALLPSQGRLVVVGFEAPAGRIASIGRVDRRGHTDRPAGCADGTDAQATTNHLAPALAGTSHA